MAQIGFTHKTEPIYDRFNALRRAYEDANGGGRVYNPDFLAVLMDHWERVQVQGNIITIATTAQLEAHDKRFIHQYPGGNFDTSKALEYIFSKPENETE